MVREPVSEQVVLTARRTLDGLGPAVAELEADGRALELAPSVDRGYFSPSEEERLLVWFGRFLTVRAGLWEVIADLTPAVGRTLRRVRHPQQWRSFVLGYAAACLVVRLDRFLLEELAVDSLTQRKLNQGVGSLRIPRRQYTAVFESFTDIRKAALMEHAMRFARHRRRRLRELAGDELVGDLVAALPEHEAFLDPSRRLYLRRAAAFLGHALRRQTAIARQRALFTALEAGGRLASELHDRWTPPAVTPGLAIELEGLLAPGDVLVTRHERAVTNLFLPGYWPHAALYVGSEADREALGVHLDDERRRRWSGPRSVLEALKDGVRFRPLAETLAVDAVAVIRPRLAPGDLGRGLERAAGHEGKGYNFDFDFFRSDRLVCTEVVYRALDGLGEVRIPLATRAGRPTLAAEDLLGLALDGGGFDPVAVCGAPGCAGRVAVGEEAADLIRRSLRRDPSLAVAKVGDEKA